MGYELQEYQIKSILGHGGFGITYLAHNTTLNAEVAIKEYLPNEIAVREGDYTVQPKSPQEADDFAWGLERFIQEARTLAKFNHPNIVRVRHFFEAHNTAYIVMDYEEGRSLASALKGGETATEAELLAILPPLLDGLETVHKAGYLHRDIKPGNIYLRDKNQSPVLIDFGAARYDVGSRSHSMTAIVSPGYSPFEQYQTKGTLGAWTDIYALGAVLYRTIGGTIPVEATKRIEAVLEKKHDPLKPAVEVGRGHYSKTLLQAIDWALELQKTDRPQNVTEWEKALFSDYDRLHPPPPLISLKRIAIFILVVGIGAVGAYFSYPYAVNWWHTQVAERDVQDAFKAGSAAFKRGDYATAMKKLKPLAEQGNVDTQVYLGWMYANGKGVAQDDSRAFFWYHKAAVQGNATAQNNLGVRYQKGKGVAQDDSQAVYWYRKAAEQGHGTAKQLHNRVQRIDGINGFFSFLWYFGVQDLSWATPKYRKICDLVLKIGDKSLTIP
jgi:serine/threonine protein kinase